MKSTVLDGYTLNPGDLDWSGLQSLADCSIFDRTLPEQVVQRAQGSEIVLTNKVVLSEAEMAALPGLRYIGVLATGVNVIDLDAARKRDIIVTNVPAYSTPSVAQHVFALMLELTRGVGRHSRLVHAGHWVNSPDFAFWDSPQIELAGQTVGLIGFGGIGQSVARIARAFDMRVLVHTRTPDPQGWPQVEFVSLDEVFSQADILSLHCPLTEDTDHLVNARRLAMMKPSAFLINTGRGPLIDEIALAKALDAEALAGAGLDVLSKEPPAADNPLLAAKNCLITPHLAWATRAARQRLMDTVVANVQAFLSGSPQNLVS
ncbi:MAG: D-2-hydroxyacid dehydrogenase [Desulfuromonadales bacterium]|nr:D-2-hydroxyacid dehydrogenase [Desulfuromonadales bacterium]